MYVTIRYCKPWWNGINTRSYTVQSDWYLQNWCQDPCKNIQRRGETPHGSQRGIQRTPTQDIKRAEQLLADTKAINNTELKAIAERLSWRLVRSVTLRTAKGNLISRPIMKLYPLEVVSEEDNLQDSKEKFKSPEEISSRREKQPQRAAARRAALKINKLSKLNALYILLL